MIFLKRWLGWLFNRGYFAWDIRVKTSCPKTFLNAEGIGDEITIKIELNTSHYKKDLERYYGFNERAVINLLQQFVSDLRNLSLTKGNWVCVEREPKVITVKQYKN